MPTPRQLIVLGGGGFSMEPRNPRLDLYILSQSPRKNPRICFIGTASGDSDWYIQRFHRAFSKHRCRPSHLSLFKRDARDPAAVVLEQDIIYVGGGSTLNLLALWRLHGLDRALRRAYHSGTLLSGISAGMLCWFQSSCTDSFGPVRELRDGLGFLKGSACPHYHGEPTRRPTYQRLIQQKLLPPGYAADDCAALHFINNKLHRCIASRPNRHAYQLTLRTKQIQETQLPTTLLTPTGQLPE